MCVNEEVRLMGLEKYYKTIIARLEVQIAVLTQRLGYQRVVIFLEALALIIAIIVILARG